MEYEEFRLKGESQRAFEAFCKYMSLPEPRNLDDYPINGVELKTLEAYRKKWNWDERAKNISSKIGGSQKSIESIKRECEEKFQKISLNLINKLADELEKSYLKNSDVSSDDLIKIISSSSKMYSEFQKINFSSYEAEERKFDLINELILKDDKAKSLLFELRKLVLSAINN